MSKGLGDRQRIFLQALAQLERKYEPGNYFHVGAIVRHAYGLAPDLIEAETKRKEESRQFNDKLKSEAAAGDSDARMMLLISDMLSGRRHRRGRKKERKVPAGLEGAVNPSRILASLERRGLIERHAVRGGGSAALTPAGRAAVQVDLAASQERTD